MYLLGMLKKILTNQKTLHIMKRLAVKSQNEGATSDAKTLHNMKRLFIRVRLNPTHARYSYQVQYSTCTGMFRTDGVSRGSATLLDGVGKVPGTVQTTAFLINHPLKK